MKLTVEIIMNRKDREILDKGEIFDILSRCDTVRLGLYDGGNPYVVPVSFGADIAGDEIVIYFHSAKRGLKADCIKENRNICVEADIFHGTERLKSGITARYESVIGFGVVSEVDGVEKVRGLRAILEHYGWADYPVEDCGSLGHTAVYKIVLHSVTGKRNLPE